MGRKPAHPTGFAGNTRIRKIRSERDGCYSVQPLRYCRRMKASASGQPMALRFSASHMILLPVRSATLQSNAASVTYGTWNKRIGRRKVGKLLFGQQLVFVVVSDQHPLRTDEKHRVAPLWDILLLHESRVTTPVVPG